MKVLVPLDGSSLSEEILRHVRPLLRSGAHQLHLVRVLDQEAPGAPEAEAAARTYLDGLWRPPQGSHLEVRTHVVHGDPAGRIVDLSDDLPVDLIAMSTHGRTGLSRWMRGSVAERVLHAARCPLLLASPGGLSGVSEEARFSRVLVPLDGSRLAASILPHAVAWARASSADVVLLHVDVPGAGGGVHDTPEVAARRAQERAERRLNDERLRLLGEGLNPHVVGAYGDPAEQIVAAVERHDATLVAMSSHGRTGLARWQFGSVAEKVLRHCKAPLLVRCKAAR
jgi:nucleotide-binding universal stress UspA family protein